MKYFDVLHAATWYAGGGTVSAYFVSTIESASERSARSTAERRLRKFFDSERRRVVAITLGYVGPAGSFCGLAGKQPGFSLPSKGGE